MKGCPHLIYPAPGASGAWDLSLGLKAYGLQPRLFWVDCHMLGIQVLYSSASLSWIKGRGFKALGSKSNIQGLGSKASNSGKGTELAPCSEVET